MLSKLSREVKLRPIGIVFECRWRKELAPTPHTPSHHKDVAVALQKNKVTILKLSLIVHRQGRTVVYDVLLNRGWGSKVSGT